MEVLPTTALTRHFPRCVLVMSESFVTQKRIFAEDVVKHFYIFKRPLNVMWAFLRMTIGIPIELVIQIMYPLRQWKMFVPRPPMLFVDERYPLGHAGNPWKETYHNPYPPTID